MTTIERKTISNVSKALCKLNQEQREHVLTYVNGMVRMQEIMNEREAAEIADMVQNADSVTEVHS